MDLDFGEGLAIGVAFGALVLSAINIWREHIRDRVRLRVAAEGFVTDRGQEGVCVRVTNLSTSAVFLERIDIALPRRMSFQFFEPLVSTGGERLPVRLEPRTAVTFPMPPARQQEARASLARGNVRARTACGKIVRGANGRFYRRLMRDLAAAR